ncbi:MAG: hypothetical protein IH921_14205 [Gemmatimonadetes bacterium]|nr:hypothetical protein [Gemmatimonadota bacterium]
MIVFQTEGTFLMTLILLAGAVCALLCCGVAFRFSIPPHFFMGVVIMAVFMG